MKKYRSNTQSTSNDQSSMRVAILEAALDAFANHGYKAMSVRELTRKLDASHNIVHHHFGSKKALWIAAIDHAMSNVREEAIAVYEEGMRNSDPTAAITSSMHTALDLFRQHPSLARIVGYEFAMGEGERFNYIFKYHARPVSQVLELQLKQRGLSDDQSKIIVLLLTSTVTSLFFNVPLVRKLGLSTKPSKKDYEVYKQTISTFFAEGLQGFL